MDKKGLFNWLIVIGIIFLIILAFLFFNQESPLEEESPECQVDSDCVPSGCCHPTTCGPSTNILDCSDIACSLECAPGTLDCGQGSCSCNQGKCDASLGGPSS